MTLSFDALYFVSRPVLQLQTQIRPCFSFWAVDYFSVGILMGHEGRAESALTRACVSVRLCVYECERAHLCNICSTGPKAPRLLRSGSRFPMTSKVLLPLQFVELCQNHRMPFLVLTMETLSPKALEDHLPNL